jgi:hypothetical protein
MELPDLYDALDKLSGFDKNPDGSRLEPYPTQLKGTINAMPEASRDMVLAQWRQQAIDTVNGYPLEERKALLVEWARQRFLRPVQLEWVENVGPEAAQKAFETLEAFGFDLAFEGGEK